VHKDREVPDTVSTTIEYNDFQVIMSATGAAVLPASYLRTVIYGHEGTIEFRHDHIIVTPETIFAKKFEERTGRKEIRIETWFGDLQYSHMQNFFDCVRSRKSPRLNAEFGYQVMAAIGLGVEAYRSSRQMLFDPVSRRVVNRVRTRDAYEGTGMDVDESTPA
jgi:predicted dehydrogenase